MDLTHGENNLNYPKSKTSNLFCDTYQELAAPIKTSAFRETLRSFRSI